MGWVIQNNKDIKIRDDINTNIAFNRLAILLNESEEKIRKEVSEDFLKDSIASILKYIGADNKEGVDKYINNIHNAILRPEILTNAKIASILIAEHIKSKDSIIEIFCDYDADGICAGFMMNEGLKEHSLGVVNTTFPERDHGYGINMNYCKEIVTKYKGREKDVLVITVDNGITRIKEVEFLRSNGVNVIITDHHNSDSETGVPNCLIVNPHNAYEKQDDRTKTYCGTTVAFKVLQLVKEIFNVEDVIKYLPYVAVTTVTDVMSLSPENNALIQYGLEIINREDTCPKFFKFFKEASDISFVTTEQIAWSLGPMFNACGRLNKTYVASNALFNPTEENVLAVINVNDERKNITKGYKSLVEKLDYKDKIIVHTTDTKKCPKGTIGILAGKIAEHFKRPSLAVLNSNGVYHGSARSHSGINVYNIFKDLKAEGIIMSYGGHAEACVCEFKEEKLEDFRKALNSINLMDYTSSIIDEDRLIMSEINLEDLNEYTYAINSLIITDKCKPPMISIDNVKIQSLSVSKNNSANIKLTVKGNRVRSLWAFGHAEKVNNIAEDSDYISLIGPIKKNSMGYGYILGIEDVY